MITNKPKCQILFNKTLDELRVAVVEDRVLTDFFVNDESRSDVDMIGHIRVGQVKRIMPGLQAAFIDCGLSRLCFLHVKDINESKSLNSNNDSSTKSSNQSSNQSSKDTELSLKWPPIEQFLTVGQTFWVQVIKNPVAQKGARLSTSITLPGRYLVYMPHGTEVMCSKRIEGDDLRQSLVERIEKLTPNITGGWILRTLVAEATPEDLESEVNHLSSLWEGLLASNKRKKTGQVIWQDNGLLERVLRDRLHLELDEIVVEDDDMLSQVKSMQQVICPGYLGKYTVHKAEEKDNVNIFNYYNIESQLQKCFQDRVKLPSAGYLILEKTEAMTVIDVNSGSQASLVDRQDALLKTNIEAARVIAWLLRLRNIGGIVVIDFIDMESDKDNNLVKEELLTLFKSDKARTTVGQFSEFGLLELTRKRTSLDVYEQVTSVCGTCSGTGRIASLSSNYFCMVRDIESLSITEKSKTIEIQCSSMFYDYAKQQQGRNTSFLEESYVLNWCIEDTWHSSSYRVRPVLLS